MKKVSRVYEMCVLFILVVTISGCGGGNALSASRNENILSDGNSVEMNNADFVEEEQVVSEQVNSKGWDEDTSEEQKDEEIKEVPETSVSKDYIMTGDFKPSEGLEFESNGDGTCTLKGIGICSDENLVIPMESPTGDKVTLIDEYAFYSLEDVDSITLVNCDCEIDSYAFQYGEFTSLNIIGGSPILGKSVFSSCEDLISIVISDCNLQTDEYAFFSCGKDMNVILSNCTGVIDQYAFQYSDMLTLEINDCELEVEKSAFSTCENLEVITVINSTIHAKEYAFFRCGNSAKVDMTNCEIVLDDYAFQYSSLDSLTISGSKLEAGKSAFSSCDNLNIVTIDCDLVTLDEYAFFSCEDLINVSLGEKATDNTEINIDDYAFQYCKRLEIVTMGSGTVEMGKYAFTGCADRLKISKDGSIYTAESVEEGISL